MKIRKNIFTTLLLTALVAGVGVNANAGHVYLDSANGSDANDGTTKAKAVKHWTVAFEKLKSAGHTSADCIVMCSTYNFGSNVTIDGKITDDWNATFIRHNDFKGAIFTITGTSSKSGTDSLVMRNITLSGLNGQGVATVADAPLIDAADNIGTLDHSAKYKLVLDEGVVLADNDNCKNSGGAVRLKDCSMIMRKGSLIQNCKSTYRSSEEDKACGGAIEIRQGDGSNTVFTMNGGIIDGCQAYVFGGAVRAISTDANGKNITLNLNSGEIRNCSCFPTNLSNSDGRGGAIEANGSKVTVNLRGPEMKIHHNSCHKFGGGIQMQAQSVLNISAGEIYENTAGGQGWEYDRNSGAGGIHLTSDVTMNMTGGKIHHNFTTGKGGGLHCSYEGDITITGGEFYNNTAYIQGGAMNLNTASNLTIPEGTDVKFYNNRAGRGGAVTVDMAAITIGSGEFTDNHAIITEDYPDDLPAQGIGGAFCLTMETLPKKKKAELIQSQFSMSGGLIKNNTAALSGGAVYIKEKSPSVTEKLNDPKLIITGGSIVNNSAFNGDGGGFYVAKGTATISNGIISDNSASGTETESGNGGGFYIKGDVTVTGSNMLGNVATGNGGAISISGGSLTFINGNLGIENSFNQARNGAAVYIEGGDATITGGSINYNQASCNGGGICAMGGNIDLNGGNITMNRAMGEDGFGGGAIYSKGGVVTIADGIVLEKNVSKEYGGAVYLDNGGTINVNSCTFRNNSANVAGTAIIQNGTMNVTGTPVFGDDQTVHLPHVTGTPSGDYKYRVITKVGAIGADTKIPVTLDQEEEIFNRDILVSKKDAADSDGGQVIADDLGRIDVRLQLSTLCSDYKADGLDAAKTSYVPKDVIHLAGLSQIIIVRKGLAAGESAIYTVSDGGTKKFNVSLTGKDDGGTVQRVITGIKPGSGQTLTITAAEQPWSWSYNHTALSVDPSAGSEVAEDKLSAKGKLGELQSLIFTFDGGKKDKLPKHGEGSEVNDFSKYGQIKITIDVQPWGDGGRTHFTF